MQYRLRRLLGWMLSLICMSWKTHRITQLTSLTHWRTRTMEARKRKMRAPFVVQKSAVINSFRPPWTISLSNLCIMRTIFPYDEFKYWSPDLIKPFSWLGILFKISFSLSRRNISFEHRTSSKAMPALNGRLWWPTWRFNMVVFVGFVLFVYFGVKATLVASDHSRPMPSLKICIKKYWTPEWVIRFATNLAFLIKGKCHL